MASGVTVGMIISVILGDGMDLADPALTNLSFIVCSFGFVIRWSQQVLPTCSDG